MSRFHPIASISETLQSRVFSLNGKEPRTARLTLVMGILFAVTLSVLCAPAGPAAADMDIEQTLSDGAQRCTIAFDGFAFITGNLEAQSFFPPGKVADYWGFQYLRDNTPNGNGHNTSFLTNCAFNILFILNSDQFTMLKTLAASQVDQINLYAYERFPLMKAFRRQMEGDLPAGSSGLSLEAVKEVSRDLYELDGRISFDRAVVYASIFKTLDASQKAHMDAMKAGGFDSWTVTPEMDSAVRNLMRGVSHDVSVALMTYAGDLFSWYAGSLDADVYFCPERQGTYFGSFYVKDAPAIGHEGYKINEQLTASAGQMFLDELAATHLDTLVTNLVDEQRSNLYAGTSNIVQVRTDISMLLRSLITVPSLTEAFKAEVLAQVLDKSRTYGELDGEIVYSYATAFSQVYQSMTSTQKANLTALRKTILSGEYNGVPFDFSVCTTPFLYSAVIQDPSVLSPYISNTDELFAFESAMPVVTVVATNAQAAEQGRQKGQVRVDRTGDTVKPLTVTYSVSGTATNGIDYTRLSGRATIPAKASSVSVNVVPINDGIFEEDETVVLALQLGAAYLLGEPDSATVTIADNDLPAVSITAADADASETRTDPGQFIVSRTGSTHVPLVVYYTVSGTAVNGDDYAAIPGSITLPAGASSGVLVINPVDDQDYERSETVTITLTADPGYIFGSRKTATVTISDNDLPTVTVIASDTEALEAGANKGQFIVYRTGVTGKSLRVRYGLSGTATNGTDYTRLSGVVTISARASSAAITVTPKDDTIHEGDEIVVVTLVPDSSYVVGFPGDAALTITDND